MLRTQGTEYQDFNEEYANGKLSSLRGMQIEYINFCTESDSDSDIVITDMTFEDKGEQYTPEHLLPYVISDSEEEFDIETCCRAAEDGCADAQYKLGRCYEDGDGVEKDAVKAAELYRKAAEQGDSDAQCTMAICYIKGIGVEPDTKQVVYWYKKAAEQGDSDAQYKLGMCYENGWGVLRNSIMMLRWYKKAAAQGEENAIEALKRLGV